MLVAFLITASIAVSYMMGCLFVGMKVGANNMVQVVVPLTIITWILYFIQ